MNAPSNNSPASTPKRRRSAPVDHRVRSSGDWRNNQVKLMIDGAVSKFKDNVTASVARTVKSHTRSIAKVAKAAKPAKAETPAKAAKASKSAKVTKTTKTS